MTPLPPTNIQVPGPVREELGELQRRRVARTGRFVSFGALVEEAVQLLRQQEERERRERV
jgi:hypothetical protein